jgi:protein TonB
MNPNHSCSGKAATHDWALSLGLHTLLLVGVGWGVSHSTVQSVMHVPLDLSVSWVAPEPPAAPLLTKPPPPVPQPTRTPLPAVAKREVAPSLVTAPDVVVAAAPVVPPPALQPAQAQPVTQAAPVAAVAPTAAAKVDEQPRWHNHLEAMLVKHKHYPTVARRMRQEGIVTVEAHFSPQGDVVRCLVAISSGFKALDEAAVQLVRQAAEVTRIQNQPGRVAELRIPIVYELKDS